MALQTPSSAPQAVNLANQSIDWLAKRRFQILFLLLLLQVVIFCLQGIWVEDFWPVSLEETLPIQEAKDSMENCLDTIFKTL